MVGVDGCIIYLARDPLLPLSFLAVRVNPADFAALPKTKSEK
jgi:hypothetical protein